MRISNPRISRVYVVALTCLATVAGILVACGGDVTITGTNTGKSRNCDVSFGSGWPMDGTFQIDKPTECPYQIPFAESVDYAAVGTFPFGDVTTNQFQVSLTNRVGTPTQIFVNAVWSSDNSNDIVTVNGDYQAASAGFDSNNAGFDNANNQVLTGQGWVSAVAHLTYTFGQGSVGVIAPDSVGPDVPYTAHASISDAFFVPPVTYQWSVDGNPVAESSSDLSWNGPTSGSQTLSVTATDANNRVHTNSKVVYACSDHQITC